MYEVSVRASFAAAHSLRGYTGACERLHGHNWDVEVVLRSETLDETGMVLDFRRVKQLLAGLLEPWDHRHLNETPPFQTVNPTAENIARTLFQELAQRLPAPVKVCRATVWESPGCAATYAE
ncbi:MAG: 6-carboxytetrahydropterin synthase QueD [Planctomycetes bacterium]|nr:6-carboxytetrahydropterin synthase QueD [Planctomycetota bacterium]